MDNTSTPSNLPRLPLITSSLAAEALAPVTHIYTDLDGTLLAPGGRLLTNHAGEPSSALAEALVALKRAGIEVLIVTGRDAEQGNELLRILDLNTFIGEIGTFRLDGFGALGRTSYLLGDWEHTVLAADLAPGELPENMTPYELVEQSGVTERLFARFPGRLEPHFFFRVRSRVTHALRGFVNVEEAEDFLAGERLPLTLLDNGIIQPQVHTLKDCPEIHVYHLAPRGASKAAAVAADIAQRGLDAARTLAIGDAPGDMEMGRHTGSLVAVANALRSAQVREALAARLAAGRATFVTEASTADGWLQFAHALLAAKRTASATG
ncbi:MAG: HAD hydrolase family protein [Coriobacteriales bacterium]|nr:HAD hydrolase family protein [Coriobacteriales bacterium]